MKTKAKTCHCLKCKSSHYWVTAPYKAKRETAQRIHSNSFAVSLNTGFHIRCSSSNRHDLATYILVDEWFLLDGNAFLCTKWRFFNLRQFRVGESQIPLVWALARMKFCYVHDHSCHFLNRKGKRYISNDYSLGCLHFLNSKQKIRVDICFTEFPHQIISISNRLNINIYAVRMFIFFVMCERVWSKCDRNHEKIKTIDPTRKAQRITISLLTCVCRHSIHRHIQISLSFEYVEEKKKNPPRHRESDIYVLLFNLV